MLYWKLPLFVLAIIIAGTVIGFFIRIPSNNRRWSKDQEILASISTYGDNVTIHNMRSARYRNVEDYDIEYTTKTFNLRDIVKAWIMIEPFGQWLPFGLHAAHVLISFELKNGTYVAISPEIRKQKNEKFSAVRGMFSLFEIMYVVADERDVIQLRTNHRKDKVFLYPLKIDAPIVQNLFREVAHQVNSLVTKPESFNTAFNSCATNASRHLRKVGVTVPRWHLYYLVPGALDSLLHKLGLIDTNLSYKKARKHFYITEKAQQIGDVEDFSRKIRE